MKNKEYHQQYLFNSTPTTNFEKNKLCGLISNVSLENYNTQYNLFDTNGYFRKIEVDELDKIRDKNSFDCIVEKIMGVDCLIIVCPKIDYRNSIINAYRIKTLNSYIDLFEKVGINTKILIK